MTGVCRLKKDRAPNPSQSIPLVEYEPHKYNTVAEWVPIDNTASGPEQDTQDRLLEYLLARPGVRNSCVRCTSASSAAIWGWAESSSLVVMLQETCLLSLQAIMKSPWVQRNFFLSDMDEPESIYQEIPGDSFILRKQLWRAVPYFTVMMTPAYWGVGLLPGTVPTSIMGRDALFLDLPVMSRMGQIVRRRP